VSDSVARAIAIELGFGILREYGDTLRIVATERAMPVRLRALQVAPARVRRVDRDVLDHGRTPGTAEPDGSVLHPDPIWRAAHPRIARNRCEKA
jgi:hypothetical protein